MNASPALEEDELAELLDECHDDPDLFNSAILDRPPYWSRQVEIGDALVRYRTVVVYSGNAIGKDYLVGGIVPWWILTRPDSLVIVTGPSQTLIGSVTWKEIRRAITNSLIPIPMKISDGIKASPQTVTVEPGWGALGYSTTNVERASGQHNANLLIIVEEASGVDDEVWAALDGLKCIKMLVIGNPIRPDGKFVELIRQAEKDEKEGVPDHLRVKAIRIPSTESPHADIDQSPYGLADKTWLADMIRRHGKDSNWVRSHIKAEIPETSSEALLRPVWLDACTAAARVHHRGQGHQLRMAIDLGEGVGRDSTVILVRDDWGILKVVRSNTLGLPGAAAAVAQIVGDMRIPHVRVSYDAMGVGRHFPADLARYGITAAIPYVGEGSPRLGGDYTNLRTEAAWNLRLRLDPESPSNHGTFHIPPGDWREMLFDELVALDYHPSGTKTQLILKRDILAKLGHSPDLADALIQSFAF